MMINRFKYVLAVLCVIHQDSSGMLLLRACLRADRVSLRRLGRSVQSESSRPFVFGTTALHQACISGEEEGVVKILDKGLYVNAIDSRGQTPLHVAARRDDPKMVKLLIYAMLNKRDNRGNSPLDLAISNKSTDAMAELLRHTDVPINLNPRPDRCTPLHMAGMWDNPQAVSAVIAKGYSVDEKDSGGQTPLHVACRHRSYAAISALLAHRADPTVINNEGVSALAMADDEVDLQRFMALVHDRWQSER